MHREVAPQQHTVTAAHYPRAGKLVQSFGKSQPYSGEKKCLRAVLGVYQSHGNNIQRGSLNEIVQKSTHTCDSFVQTEEEVVGQTELNILMQDAGRRCAAETAAIMAV